MNWRGSFGKRMDRPGQVLVNNVLNGHAVIFTSQLLWIQNSDLSSQTLYSLGIRSGHSSSYLVLCRTHTHQCRVEVETDPLMIRTFLVVNTGELTEENKTEN